MSGATSATSLSQGFFTRATQLLDTAKESSHKLSPHLLHLSSRLTDLPCIVHINQKRIFSPIMPGKYGQKETSSQELFYRAILSLRLVPLGCLALTSGLASMPLRFFGIHLQRNEQPFSLFQLPQKGKSLPKEKKASLFSLNVCGIGGGFPLTHGGILPWNQRFNQIINLVKDKDPDFVCLQEIHDTVLGARLRFTLTEKGYSTFCYNMSPQNFGADSGLFFATKYDIQNPSFTPFSKKDVLNEVRHVNKGFFSVELIDNSTNKPFCRIYTTHLQHSQDDSNPTKNEQNVRKNQMNQILLHMQEKHKENALPTLLTGDLNMGNIEFSQHNPNFYNAFLEKNSENPFTAATQLLKAAAKNLSLSSSEKSSSGKKTHLLDHTLVWKPTDASSDSYKKALSYTESISTFDLEKPDKALSDHYALISELSFPDFSSAVC